MLEEYMQTIGYTRDEIDMIEASYPLRSYTESTLLYCIKNLVNYLHRNTFDNKDIIYVTTTIPQIISMSIENIKVKVDEFLDYGISKINIYHMLKKYPYIIEMSTLRIHNKYQVFDELGFSLSATNQIFIERPSILNIDLSTIKSRYSFFKDFGYKQYEIHTILSAVPELFTMSEHKIQNKIDEYYSLGFKKDEIIKITYYFPSLFIFDKEEVRSQTEFMEKYGYSIEDILSIIKRVPMILNSFYVDGLEKKWALLEELGFSSNEIVSLSVKNPYLLLYSYDCIKDNYHNFINNGFYHKEVIQMLNDTPLLFGYNKDNINKKIEYYSSLDLTSYIKLNSKVLLYSLDFIKKRKKYISSHHYEDLFLSDEEFQKHYHVSRKDILKEK